MPIFLFSNALVFLSSSFLAGYFSPKNSRSDYILTFSLFFIAQIILIELVLGMTGRLYVFNILICVSFLPVISYFGFRKFNPDLSITEKVLPEFLSSKILLFSAAVFLGFFIPQLWITFSNPPLRSDALIYHLTFPVTWLKNANLVNPLVAFGTGDPPAPNMSISYFPFNAELLFFWLIFPFRSAFLANIAQAPFYFIAILAVYSILRKFSVPRDTCLLTGILWALVPNVFKHLKEGAYIDVICAALFFMVINYMLVLNENFNRKNALLLGIASGIFMGLKTLNIYWLFALAPLFACIAIKENRKLGAAGILKISGLIMFAFLIFSGYPFVRNFILTKNIFYPIKTVIFGKTIMPGYIGRLQYADLTYHFNEFSLKKLFFSEGLGLQFFLFVLAGTFVPFFAALFKFDRKRKEDILKLLLYFVPFCMFMLYLFYIKAYWSRYLYSFLGAAFIAAVLFLGRFKWGRSYIGIAGLLCILSSMPELARHGQLYISLIFSFGLFLFILQFKKVKAPLKFFSLKPVLPAVTVLVILSGFLFIFSKRYENEEFSRYVSFYRDKEAALGWKWLNDNTAGAKKIAYAGQPETYPLFGSRLKNDVFYVSVNDKQPVPHSYADGYYRKGADFSTWLKNLKKEKIDFIFVSQMHYSKEFPLEDSWMKENPDNFRAVYSNPKIRIYSFLNG